MSNGEQDERDKVSVLEREVEGEKMVTRHILEHTRRNGDDLAELKAGLKKIEISLGTRIDGVEGKVDSLTGTVDGLASKVDNLTGRVEGLTGRVDGLASKVDSLITSLPRIVGNAVSDVLNGRHDRS